MRAALEVIVFLLILWGIDHLQETNEEHAIAVARDVMADHVKRYHQ